VTTTRSIPHWSVFCSTLTNLALIYESVTSASVVRWVTAHGWIPTSEVSYGWTNSYITSGRTEYVTLSYSSTLTLFLCVHSFSNGFPPCSLLRERMLSEPLASNGFPLWLQYPGFQVSCHNIKTYITEMGCRYVAWTHMVREWVKCWGFLNVRVP
jgi:hypothetical protein